MTRIDKTKSVFVGCCGLCNKKEACPKSKKLDFKVKKVSKPVLKKRHGFKRKRADETIKDLTENSKNNFCQSTLDIEEVHKIYDVHKRQKVSESSSSNETKLGS